MLYSNNENAKAFAHSPHRVFCSPFTPLTLELLSQLTLCVDCRASCVATVATVATRGVSAFRNFLHGPNPIISNEITAVFLTLVTFKSI